MILMIFICKEKKTRFLVCQASEVNERPSKMWKLKSKKPICLTYLLPTYIHSDELIINNEQNEECKRRELKKTQLLTFVCNVNFLLTLHLHAFIKWASHSIQLSVWTHIHHIELQFKRDVFTWKLMSFILNSLWAWRHLAHPMLVNKECAIRSQLKYKHRVNGHRSHFVASLSCE